MPANKIKELAERCEQGIKRGGFNCWASRLDGDARLFIDEMRKMKEAGKPFSMHEVVTVLRELGVDIQISAVRNHVTRKCRCE